MESSFMISPITAVSHIRFLKIQLNFTDFVQVEVFIQNKAFLKEEILQIKCRC